MRNELTVEDIARDRTIKVRENVYVCFWMFLLLLSGIVILSMVLLEVSK